MNFESKNEVEPSHPEIADEILKMAEEDQAMRRTTAVDPEKWDPSVDDRLTVRLKQIIESIGWPTRPKVGDEASHMAWLLAQHAKIDGKADLEFQKRCLSLMRETEKGDLDPDNIPYLEDRVRVGEGRPQLYGTQFGDRPDGTYGPMPIEDEAHVEERRSAAGMDRSYKDYYDWLMRQHEEWKARHEKK